MSLHVSFRDSANALARWSQSRFRRFADAAGRVASREDGGLEDVIKIAAAVVIIGLLLVFGKDIYEWIVERVNEMLGR
jgi:hypothetical protein